MHGVARLALRLTLLVSVLAALGPQAAAQAQDAPDFDVPGGHFFAQTGGGGGKGYAVVDDDQARFWSEFQRLGGVQAVGYPASQRFRWDGFTVQAFQRVVFQWRPDQNAVAFVNVFDKLHDLGKDDALRTGQQVPPPRSFDDAGKPFDQVQANHLAALEADPAIKAKYDAAVGDPVQANGLPVSNPVDMGNVVVLRAQRVVFQRWKQDVPWAKAGDVTVALGGDIAKEMGILPDANALQPIAAPAGGPAPAASAPPSASYVASFDGPGCELGAVDDITHHQGCVDGEFQILSKKDHEIDWALHRVDTAPDFDVAVDLRFASATVGYAGLVFNVTAAPGAGPDSGYRFELTSTGRYTLATIARDPLTKDVVGGRVLVPAADAPGFRPGQRAHLRATRAGATITLYVNGQRVAAVDDTSQPGHLAGVWAGTQSASTADARFDNFAICPAGTAP